MAVVKIPLEQRFWSKVLKTDSCWLWQAQLNNKGYGVFMYYSKKLKRRSRQMYAHRVSWTLTNGEIPPGLHVLHKCDTPACCRPDHLALGTQKENMQDAKSKGRIKRPPMSTLRMTADEIRGIRADTNSYSTIARHFGISRGYVWAVKHRRAWRDLV